MNETPRRGDRVRLVGHTDPHSPLQPGTLGTVTGARPPGTVQVRWDDGSSLGLLADEGDQWELVLPAE